MQNRTILRRLVGVPAILVLVALSAPAHPAKASQPLSCKGNTCAFSLRGTSFQLNFGGSRISCQRVTGRGRYIPRSVGSARLAFHGCKEHVTVLGFRCSGSSGAPSRIETPTLPTQVSLADGTPRVQLLGLRVSMVCAGALSFNVEGFLIGHVNQRSCSRQALRYPFEGVIFAHGQMGSGPLYDVYTDPAGQSYRLPGPWQMTFRKKAAFEC